MKLFAQLAIVAALVVPFAAQAEDHGHDHAAQPAAGEQPAAAPAGDAKAMDAKKKNQSKKPAKKADKKEEAAH